MLPNCTPFRPGRCAVAAALGLLAAAAFADGRDHDRIEARLKSYQEVPAVSSVAGGRFKARLSDTQIDYELTYSDLEGTVTQSHIHFGQRSVNGGIMVFLCSNLGNGPAGTPACPVPGGTVSGTLSAATMVAGANAQGVAPGDFAEMLRAIRAGVAYVNVHSSLFPGGEIRGQLKDDD
jgi:CHRD domain